MLLISQTNNILIEIWSVFVYSFSNFIKPYGIFFILNKQIKFLGGFFPSCIVSFLNSLNKLLTHLHVCYR